MPTRPWTPPPMARTRHDRSRGRHRPGRRRCRSPGRCRADGRGGSCCPSRNGVAGCAGSRPTEIAPAAGAAAAPAAPAAQTPAAPAVVAGDGGETPAVNARPAVKATPATPATRAAPATSATPATPAVPPTETVEGDAGKALADQMSNRPEKVQPSERRLRRPSAAPDPAMRSQDSAAAVKTGADLVQNLGVNAPAAPRRADPKHRGSQRRRCRRSNAGTSRNRAGGGPRRRNRRAVATPAGTASRSVSIRRSSAGSTFALRSTATATSNRA